MCTYKAWMILTGVNWCVTVQFHYASAQLWQLAAQKMKLQTVVKVLFSRAVPWLLVVLCMGIWRTKNRVDWIMPRGLQKDTTVSLVWNLSLTTPPPCQRHQSSMKTHIPVLWAQFCPFLTLWALTHLSLRRKASVSSGDLKKTSQGQLPSAHCSIRFPP